MDYKNDYIFDWNIKKIKDKEILNNEKESKIVMNEEQKLNNKENDKKNINCKDNDTLIKNENHNN
jgi:hypothetical protein